MACVRLTSGREVLTHQQYAEWWDSDACCERRKHGADFFDLLRQAVAHRMNIGFRQLELVCEGKLLEPSSPWTDTDAFVAVLRPFVPASATQKDQLFRAVRGDLASLVSLLEEPHNPNTSDRRGESLLHAAASNVNAEFTRCLLEACADKDGEDHYGATPLHVAASKGHQEIALCLLKAGADKNRDDSQGETPLHVAAAHGRLEVVRCLLDAGAEKDKHSNVGETALHIAVDYGHLEIVCCLLEAGADQDKVDGVGRTSLHFAAAQGQVEILLCLLQADADKDRGDCDGKTPLHVAAAKGKSEIVRCMLEAGADKDQHSHCCYEWTPLHCAAQNGDLDVVSCLLGAGADKDQSSKYGLAPLHLAAEAGHVEVGRCLLEAGADKNKADDAGRTPLHSAALHGSLEVVRLLLEAGSEKDRSDKDGWTPLHVATAYNHPGIVRCLLDAGACNLIDNQGSTPAWLAVLKHTSEIERMLVDSEKDVGKSLLRTTWSTLWLLELLRFCRRELLPASLGAWAAHELIQKLPAGLVPTLLLEGRSLGLGAPARRFLAYHFICDEAAWQAAADAEVRKAENGEDVRGAVLGAALSELEADTPHSFMG
ncbi:unnamed protein product [Effrenium voratum]|nr:unnamed protein product [Effrenium voratum]